MSSGARQRTRFPRCPRCGYDQSGLIASWTRSCPLEATCAECGYGFDPFDALYPTRRHLPWLYEHAQHWWSVSAAIKTLAMLLWPPAFWKRVRPEHEVRVGRIFALFVWPYVLMLLALFVLALAEHITSVRQWYGGPTPPPWGAAVSKGLWEFRSWIVSADALEWRREMLPIEFSAFMLGVFWLPVTCAFLAIPSEWSGTRLRRKHLARLFGYAALPLTIPPLIAGTWHLGIQWYQVVYLLLPAPQRLNWPEPWGINLPRVAFPALIALGLFWTPLYWFSAIRWGYALPSTKRPFGVALAVLLTPWALFLVFMGYYAFFG